MTHPRRAKAEAESYRPDNKRWNTILHQLTGAEQCSTVCFESHITRNKRWNTILHRLTGAEQCSTVRFESHIIRNKRWNTILHRLTGAEQCSTVCFASVIYRVSFLMLAYRVRVNNLQGQLFNVSVQGHPFHASHPTLNPIIIINCLKGRLSNKNRFCYPIISKTSTL